jgi:hypothetical protein
LPKTWDTQICWNFLAILSDCGDITFLNLLFITVRDNSVVTFSENSGFQTLKLHEIRSVNYRKILRNWTKITLETQTHALHNQKHDLPRNRFRPVMATVVDCVTKSLLHHGVFMIWNWFSSDAANRKKCRFAAHSTLR